ncbi:hypothetical protein NOK12_29700 [Nocardioides sp. OK12]|uniref:MFS transporter n=1 Tax=Nocardioides sp. OK12 TaxID=2758661 RepID=UPI0021C26607|nr:MFS transporter [Nocardioides sp. OK12]GHJ60452.1 hypothetical protein NOK12_29700 [Nocardioides sp. OK12]
MGVAFGMARYAYGLTLPDMQAEFDLSEQLTGLVASATFVGYLVGLLGVPVLVARRGPRAPTSVGGACGVLGCSLVAVSPTPAVLAVGAVLAGSAAGWVWAPYSDVLRAVAAPQHRPTLLAVVTTGTGVGLVGLGALGLLAPFVSWRLTWAGIAVAAAVAAVLNLRLVPALPPPERQEGGGRLPWARLLVPLLYTVAYFVAVTVYFTYASDAAEEAGMADWAPALVFALIGLGGLVAFWTGRMTALLGPTGVGAASLGVVGLALVGLGLAPGGALVLASALVLGAGFMVGSSVLAIWTAEASPERPGTAFTAALVVGAVTSIVTPTVTGALVPGAGLGTVLVLAGGLAAACAALLAATGPARSVLARG